MGSVEVVAPPGNPGHLTPGFPVRRGRLKHSVRSRSVGGTTNGEITNGGINLTPQYSGFNPPSVFLPQQFTGAMGNPAGGPPMIVPSVPR